MKRSRSVEGIRSQSQSEMSADMNAEKRSHHLFWLTFLKIVLARRQKQQARRPHTGGQAVRAQALQQFNESHER
jgi:hypothetical protein